AFETGICRNRLTFDFENFDSQGSKDFARPSDYLDAPMAAASSRSRPFWLTTRVARRLNCSSETVREYERKGWLPATKTETGTRLFDPDVVERFARDREGHRREREQQSRSNTEPLPAA